MEEVRNETTRVHGRQKEFSNQDKKLRLSNI